MKSTLLYKLCLFLGLIILGNNAFSNCNFVQGLSSETFSTSGLCGPVTVNWNVSYSFLAAVNPAQVRFRFEWNDGSNTVYDVGAVCSSGNTICSPASGTQQFTYPSTSTDCEYFPTVTMAFDANSNGTIDPGELCTSPVNTTLSKTVRSYGTDAAGVGLLAINPSLTQQCVGVPLSGFQFQDASIPNCNSSVSSLPNELGRWVQFVYGTTNESGPYIPNVSVMTGSGPVQITDAAGMVINQLYGPIIEIPPFVTIANLDELSFPISYGTNTSIGQIFEVTLRNWNTCNKYDNIPFDGLPPTNIVDGDNPPVSTTAKIELIGPTYSNAGSDQVVCNASAILSANTVSVGTGQWLQVSGPGTLTFNDPNSENSSVTISGNDYGTYTMEWSINLGSCVSSDTIEITFNPNPTTPVTGPDQEICGLSTSLMANIPLVGTAQWIQTSGPTGLIIANPSNRNSAISAVNYGAYTIEWQISNANCITLSDPVSITFYDNPSTAIAGPDKAVCGNVTNFDALPLVAGIGQWSIISSPLGSNPVINNIANANSILSTDSFGIYLFEWTASNGTCPSNSDMVEVTFADNPSQPLAGPDEILCGLSTTLIGNVPDIGTGQWVQSSGPSGLIISNPFSAQTLITANTYGDYIFEWQTSNANCPVKIDSVSITFQENPSISNAGSDQMICGLSTNLAGNQISIGAGQWSVISSPLGSSPFISNFAQNNATFLSDSFGEYQLQWTASNGVCLSNSDTVIITFSEDPSTPNAGIDQFICDLNTNLSANFPDVGIGSWSQVAGPSGLIITNTNDPLSGISTGNYGLYVLEWQTSNANCPVQTDIVEITFLDTPSTAIAGPDQTVCGTNTILSGNQIIPGSGQWSISNSPSGSNPNITNVNNRNSTFITDTLGIYELLWTASNGTCPSNSDTINIFFAGNPSIPVTGPNQIICGLTTNLLANNPEIGTGEWVQVSGPTGLTILDPFNSQTGITASNYGVYSIEWRISNANCPILADPVQITFQQNPSTPNAGADKLICGNSTILNANSLAIGTGQWTVITSPLGSNPVLNNIASPNSTFQSDSLGIYTLQWTSSNGSCPSIQDQVNINFVETPDFSVSNIDSARCFGACDGRAALQAIKGTAPYFYQWDGPVKREGSSRNDLCAGSYQLTMTDKNGCQTNGNINIFQPSQITVNPIITNANCNNDDGAIDLNSNGGNGNLTYSWNMGDKTEDIDSLVAGLYFVTIRDQNNCVNIFSHAVNNVGGPSISVSTVNPVSCPGAQDGSIDISDNGLSNTYQWSNGAKTEDIVNLFAGPYQLMVEDTSTSCKSHLLVNVPEPNPLNINLTLNNATCGNSDGSAFATITGGSGSNIINWSTGGSGSSVGGLSAGVYSVTVRDVNFCSFTKNFAISEIGAPYIFTDSVVNVSCGLGSGGIYVSTTGDSNTFNYLWSNGDSVEDLTNASAGLYTLEVTDTLGCQSYYFNTIDQVTSVNPEICMVTVGTLDSGVYNSNNVVLWQKLSDPDAFDIFRIYRETTNAGQYQQIGSVSAKSPGIFTDTISNPFRKSYRYKISVVDTCGVESQLSDLHKTLHLVQSISPTGAINLQWDAYEGFSYSTFYIYRNSNAQGWEKIDSLASNSFSYSDTPPFPISDPDLFYAIVVNAPQDCDPNKKDDYNKTRSNPSSSLFSPPTVSLVDDYLLSDLIDLFPIPSSNRIYLRSQESIPQGINYSILTLNGNSLFSSAYTDEGIEITELINGLYLLKIEDGSSVRIFKFIKE